MRAYAPNRHVPGVATLLTDGFPVALWILLAVLMIAWPSLGRTRRLGLVAAACGAFVGAAAGGSRNAMLIVVGIPLIAAYLLRKGRLSRRQGAVSVGVVALILLGLTGYSAARSSQATTGISRFVVAETHGSKVKRGPLLLYVGGVFAFETERRMTEQIPQPFDYSNGVATLQLLPDLFFPEGKPDLGSIATATGLDSNTPPYWTVSTYQGRAFDDFGTIGVIVESLVLGLFFGLAYQLCRGRTWLVAAVVGAYVAYYAAFSFYESLLSVNPAFMYDLLLLAGIEAVARARGKPQLALLAPRRAA
jgi:oligosaccharide repeat unit polymerase